MLVLTFVLAMAGQPGGDPEHPYVTRQRANTAASAADSAAELEQETRVVCRRERDIGSNRSRRVCEHVAVIQDRRERIQRDLERRIDVQREVETSHHQDFGPPGRVD